MILEVDLEARKVYLSPVLGPLDGQFAPGEANKFIEACDRIEPLKEICTEEFEPFKEFGAFVYTHDKGWIEVKVQPHGWNFPKLWISSDIQINGGTSGGPVVTENNELIGVVSWVSDRQPCEGVIPRPHLALPTYICKKILIGENT